REGASARPRGVLACAGAAAALDRGRPPPAGADARSRGDLEDDRALDLGGGPAHEGLAGWIGDRNYKRAPRREPDRQYHHRLAELPWHHRSRVPVDVDSVQIQVRHAGLLGEHAGEIVLEDVAETDERLAQQLTILRSLCERPVELVGRDEALVEQDRAEL